ncbi:hypothetical protein BACI348_41268 [Bacillus altitudinis]|uniref:Uncharacterized protein n=1 Tax=Bacillus altitudinis TaxID=293387 RepID=A0A653SGJ7_BACAB|nr:hypothetical protein BACI348_41268 [Bacillus altitudinis]
MLPAAASNTCEKSIRIKVVKSFHTREEESSVGGFLYENNGKMAIQSSAHSAHFAFGGSGHPSLDERRTIFVKSRTIRGCE